MKRVTKKENAFERILEIIQSGQSKAYSAVNSVMLETYWNIGAFLSAQVNANQWGKSIVAELSQWLSLRAHGMKGFSSQNLWRMKQLYELYKDDAKLSPLVREIGWTQNCIIMAQCKTPEEREFYLRSVLKAHWKKRELEQQIASGEFEPSHLGQLAFYMEALDRQRKRPHENPTIGVLLCKSKDDEVVELALSTSMTPALVSEYETKLVPKEVLRKKLHDWSLLLEEDEQEE